MKKIICMLLSVLMLASMSISLIGCGNKEHEPITILSGGMVYKELEDKLHEKYPEIKLEIIPYGGGNMSCYMRQSLDNGDIPDIYTTTYFQDIDSQKNNLVDLSKYGFINNYTDAMLRSVNVDGGIYLVPSYYSLFGMYYNRTVFEKYGWEVPTSFEELVTLKDKCAEVGIEPFRSRMDLNGYIFTYLFGLGNTGFFGTADGEQWKKDFLTGKANAVGNIEPTVEYLKKWIDEGFIDAKDIGNNSSNPTFMGGLAAMHLCTNYSVKSLDWSVREDHPEYGLQEYGIIPYLSEDGSNNMLISNVTRYYGLSKELEKRGNKQKLEDALHVLEFMASDSGNTAMGITGVNMLSTLNSAEIAPESFFYEVRDTVEAGQFVSHTWAGWEDITNPIADVLHAFVRGEKTVDEVCADFDRIRNDYLTKGYEHFAHTDDLIDTADAARICGIADIKAAGADAALVSMPGFRGFFKYDDRDGYGNLENAHGANGKLYAGTDIGVEEINVIRQPNQSLCTAQLTGKEIKDIAAAGFKLYEECDAFDYVLTTKNDAELDDSTTYTLVFAKDDFNALPEDQITVIDLEETGTAKALTDFLTELGDFSKSDVKW